MARRKGEEELDLYRNLLDTPTEFKDGFGWTTVAGIFFCGLIMMPGSIYMGLMFGSRGAASAASWVTVILFMEVARRALKPLQKQQLVILLHAARAMMAGHILFPGGPFAHLIFRAYVVSSEIARDAGMSDSFPTWWCPKPNSPAITERMLFHPDWLMPVAIMVGVSMIALVKKYTMGYFFFRLTSDVENLPFPLAPIRAQGAMALAEADEKVTDKDLEDDTEILTQKRAKKKSLRWRIFSLGVAFGILFGFFKVGIPAITGLVLTKPFFLIPQPWVDTTTLTETILPATPTGIKFDPLPILTGFVLPFWSIMGTFLAIAFTILLNPILHSVGVLHHWQPGMDTINTAFANQIDFWMSFTIGSALGIAAVCFYSTFRDLRTKSREIHKQRETDRKASLWDTPEKGRGDYPLWIALLLYILAAGSMVLLGYILLPKQINILLFLIFFAFVYSPFISYVNARLLGMSGQHVRIPYIKDAIFILSGARGIEIWLAPIPIDHFGRQAQSFRINELTGVSFFSLLKADLTVMPVLMSLSFVFWAFIWKSDAIPSETFPAASKLWELQAKKRVLLWSSTFVAPGEDPEEKTVLDSPFFREAIHPKTIASGAGMCIGLYVLLSAFGLPIMLIYGMIRGLGHLPHFMVLEIVGALLGRLYFHKKHGRKKFLRQAPTLLAGYVTGEGLIAMATIALKLIKAAVSGDPF